MKYQRGHGDFTGIFVLVGIVGLLIIVATGFVLYRFYKWIAS